MMNMTGGFLLLWLGKYAVLKYRCELLREWIIASCKKELDRVYIYRFKKMVGE